MFPRCSLRDASQLPAFRPLALSLMLLGGAAGTVAWAPAVLAQTPAPTQAARSYDIPPGPLNGVLTRFSRETGVFLISAGKSVEGKLSPGLKGSYAPQAGFAALLAGTGLEAYPQSQDSYGLRDAIAAPAVAPTPIAPTATAPTSAMLPTVTITGETTREGTSEGTGSYQARFTNTATKLTLSPRETPQTITTITRQQIDDAGMTSLDDALKSVSGVFAQEQGSAGATYFSRGFNLQTQIDGMVTPAGLDSGNRSPKYDSAFVDRIEVLQGAAGLLTGAGNPGGTVNLVRKRPTDTFQAQAEMQLGSWNARRFVGDVSSPLVESGRIRGRLVAVDDRSDSFTDHVYRDRRAFYGIIEADLSPGTLLTASVQYQQDESLNHFGVPFAGDGSDARLPRSSFWGDPNYRLDRDYTIYTIGLAQQLGGGWNLNANYSRQKTQNDISNFNALTGSLNAATGNGLSVTSRSRFNSSVLNADSADVYASGPFGLFGRKHELVVGANGAKYQDEATGTGYLSGATPINVYAFNPDLLGLVANSTPSRSQSTTTSLGLYSVARWSLTDSLKLITGMRNSYYEVKNDLTGRVTSKQTGETTPYAGLVYDIDSQYSTYVSYSDIFRPQTNRGVDGNVIDPIVGANYEAGVKGELLDKRLNVAAAVFKLTQSNLSLRDDSIPANPGNACGGTCYTASGKVVSQGLDVSVNGQVGRNLNLAFGYTFVDAEYKAGPQEGNATAPNCRATTCASPPATTCPTPTGLSAAAWRPRARSAGRAAQARRRGRSARTRWCCWGCTRNTRSRPRRSC
jgi:outer membrane receptor for ferric coprogen and ferric-rhodotorulic acid